MPIEPCLLLYLQRNLLHEILYNLLLFMLESLCCGVGLCGGDRCVHGGLCGGDRGVCGGDRGGDRGGGVCGVCGGDRGGESFPLLQISIVYQLHPPVLKLHPVLQLHPVLELVLVERLSEPECR